MKTPKYFVAPDTFSWRHIRHGKDNWVYGHNFCENCPPECQGQRLGGNCSEIFGIYLDEEILAEVERMEWVDYGNGSGTDFFFSPINPEVKREDWENEIGTDYLFRGEKIWTIY